MKKLKINTLQRNMAFLIIGWLALCAIIIYIEGVDQAIMVIGNMCVFLLGGGALLMLFNIAGELE